MLAPKCPRCTYTDIINMGYYYICNNCGQLFVSPLSASILAEAGQTQMPDTPPGQRRHTRHAVTGMIPGDCDVTCPDASRSNYGKSIALP